MHTIFMNYLEHGKIFKEGRFPSDFIDLSFTSNCSSYSKDLRDALKLDLNTTFSENPGNVSCAFIPVLGQKQFAFVQYQSRFENEFNGSHTNRPFFQTKFIFSSIKNWRYLFENKISVFPSFLKGDKLPLLNNFITAPGDIGLTFPVTFSSYDKNSGVIKEFL